MAARHLIRILALIALSIVCEYRIPAQRPPSNDNASDIDNGNFRPPEFNFGGPGGGGMGGPGMTMQQKTAVVKDFDADHNGYLDAAERKAARAKLKSSNSGRRGGPPGGGPGGPGRPGGFGARETTPTLGRRLMPADVKNHPGAPLYDPLTLRTLFLEFEDADWEKELAEFKGTDVEVPARLTVDGAVYSDVGVHFHGNSSYMMVGEGHKKSLVLTLDLVHRDQRLEGYRKLNLLNSHEDASFLRTVLSLQIARDTMAAPKANFVRVVINGECWGIYVNQQHFNKDFLRDNYGTTRGARWKIAGSPGAHGTFAYLGDDPAAYRRVYSIKSKDSPEVWAELIKLCKVLNQTPANQLEAALAPILDVDGALRFLAWDNAMANGDGFYTRNSDIDLYMDKTGRFHIVPYDANECFSSGGGPGGPPMGGGSPPGMRRMGAPPRAGGNNGPTTGTAARRGMNRSNGMRGGRSGFGPPPGFGGGPGGGMGGGGVQLDPLVAATDSNKPLIAKLLAVPALKARYLEYVRDTNEKWLDWNRLGPIAQQFHDLIDADVRADTRKIDTYEAFAGSLNDEPKQNVQPAAGGFPFGPGGSSSIKSFVEKRHEYLAQYKPANKDQIATRTREETRP